MTAARLRARGLVIARRIAFGAFFTTVLWSGLWIILWDAFPLTVWLRLAPLLRPIDVISELALLFLVAWAILATLVLPREGLKVLALWDRPRGARSWREHKRLAAAHLRALPRRSFVYMRIAGALILGLVLCVTLALAAKG